MNERIRQLAEQAGMALKPRRLYDDNEPDGYLESDDEYFEYNLEATRVFFEGGLEKFAELIVRECMKESMDEIVTDDEIAQEKDPLIREYLNGNNQGIVDAVVRFRNHFGVE